MTIPLFVVLVLVVAALAWMKRRRAALVSGLLTTAAFFVTGYGVVPNVLLANLQDGYDTEAHSWGSHNAIILLGAGAELSDRHTVETGLFGYARLVKALQVYRACTAHATDCKIIASGGDTRGLGTPEAEVFGAQLRSLGVPSADVLIEKRSRSTWQNAQFSAPFFANHRFDRVYLVTSGVHLRRSLLYFAHFGIQAAPVRADYGRAAAAPLPVAANFFLADAAIHEYLGLWRYDLYNVLGWNAKPATPGAP